MKKILDSFADLAREIKLAIVVSVGLLGTIASIFYFGFAILAVFIPITIAARFAYLAHVRKLESKAEQLMEANRVHLATVEALATAIDARDQVASGHVRRMQIYAAGLGTKLGLNEGEIEALKMGALLHDIGKLAVPDHILSKTGQLTKAELDKVKIHPAVGAAILEQIDFKHPVLETVRHHHESWDGKGYPSQLAGEQIPITARILTIADAYDSLRCTRPYRAAVSREEARQHLSRRAGSQFDPALVQMFLQNLVGFEDQVEVQGLSYNGGQQTTGTTDERRPDEFVQQIKLANREASTLYDMAREFGSTVKIEDTLTLFTDKIKEFVPFEICGIFLVDASMRYADAVHVVGENKETLKRKRIRIGEGATGFVLKKREIAKNVSPDLDFSLEHINLAHKYSTMISLPLIFDNDLIGAVSIYSRTLARYNDEHIRILETISRIAADAIGKSKQHNEAKAHALTDPMTGLANARSLKIQFEREVARAGRSEGTLRLIMMDLDGFKSVNDSYGHKVGDRLLCEVGQVILAQLREYDFLARYGGDEFVALVSDADSAGIYDLCNRIEKAVSEYELPVGRREFAKVGVSIGASDYGVSCPTLDSMVAAADRAMYDRKAKRKGKRLIVESNPISKPEETPDLGLGDGLVVELNDSHIVHSSSVN